MDTRFCIVIAGATGVGKTDFSLQLGNDLPIEIINADLGQFYQPLTIGTAKPSWQNEKIKHHLFDIYSEPHSCTVVQYRTMLQDCMHDIWNRNNIPVIVGGSTLYIESIFFEPATTQKPEGLELSKEIDQDERSLWEKLNLIDCQRALEIHPHDHYRLKRALDIWHSTGIKPSEQKPLYKPLSPFHYYYLTRDRSDLYNRIDARVMTMIEQGWLQEVSGLLDTQWQDFIMMKKFIGYPDLIEYIMQGCCESQKNTIFERIAQKTRNYAKRQETYWRRLEKKIYNCLVKTPEYTYRRKSTIHMLNLTSCNLAVYSSQQAKLIRDF